ncbi:MAG: prolipoprotein diacylglyceryl transferase family protein [Myxococcota bacterium]
MNSLLVIPWFKAEAWDVFGIPIQPFGVLVAIGVLLGAKLAEVYGQRDGIHPRVMSDVAAHVISGGFIGAFFLNAAFYNPEQVIEAAHEYRLALYLFAFLFAKGFITKKLEATRPKDAPIIGTVVPLVILAIPIYLDVQETIDNPIYLGLSSYGGFIGTALGLIVWRFRRGIPMIPIAHAGLFGMPFGWLFGRMGCFVTHDHPGRVSDFFLAVDNYNLQGQPRHDLGLYEVIWCVFCCTVFLILARKKPRRGVFAGLICVLYAPVRFGLDFLRATPADGGDVRYAGLTPGQFGSIGLLLLGLGIFWFIFTRPEIQVPPHARWPEEDPEEEKKRAGERDKKRPKSSSTARGTRNKSSKRPSNKKEADAKGSKTAPAAKATKAKKKSSGAKSAGAESAGAESGKGGGTKSGKGGGTKSGKGGGTKSGKGGGAKSGKDGDGGKRPNQKSAKEPADPQPTGDTDSPASEAAPSE